MAVVLFFLYNKYIKNTEYLSLKNILIAQQFEPKIYRAWF
ncbi:hypothetical protein SAMN05216297_11710 [Flavobacterium phragmitis]|uniref:Uncharacterized protein n=1 Tax=Flavobacterium phragmitis TaxID=739143 RepID=A0A1I1WRU6_9FLAO|nr:hypothetical protein SAMN05216297_11710 [Flavobacterium phragmitis]